MPLWKLPKTELPPSSFLRQCFIRVSKRSVACIVVLTITVLLAIGVSSFQRPETGVQATQAQSPEPGSVLGPEKAEPRYPIGGYFIAASSRDSTNIKKLTDIKASGGDTVITFGTLLQPATLESLPDDCEIDGKNCARAAAGSVSVDRYFTFLDGSNWAASALQCPRDRKVSNNGQSYSVLVLPKVGTGCSSSNGKYDVVVVGGASSSAVDPSRSLALAATKLGMKFFAGMPAPIKSAELPYLPDVSYQGTLALFTERFLTYQAKTNDLPGLAGFYHHTEMPLTDSPAFDSVLALYSTQNSAIHRILPTRQAVVSPFIDARVGTGISPDKASKGIRRIAQTSGGLVLNIAIQDGMGTGKGGAFHSREANSAVDPQAATIVGDGTWGSKYLAPNKDYFSAAAVGISGTGAVLWANLEGMAPATKWNGCADSRRGQTTKARLDRQLQQMSAARKVVSFMWDSYFTCKGTGTPLKEQIESGLGTPIITDTALLPETGQLEILGFNLRGSTASLKWTTTDGSVHKKQVRASTRDSAYGAQHGMNPQLEMITVNIGASSLASPMNYSVQVINAWEVKSTEFHSQIR
ncbi:hypothetical protein SAMN04487917_101173 [Arthrobacter sp. yr096]|uniref:hypothetical protein n=1 Tax=Arthrobacter sp. yr096 TaxID=1761750 RepID=UPI0008BDC7BC|nr:hypothetical protein [Arthrobacter sp. yr096]SEI41832.1 hypothetical protein SAMN04487917_101173 [Arthrobacter sp. yr096]